MILMMSVCDSIRHATGMPGRPTIGRIEKRVTRPVDSLPPSGLMSRLNPRSSSPKRIIAGFLSFRASEAIR